MSNYRKTKHGIAICPFFTWTSELREGPPSETDVNLVFCVHADNKDDVEGNCFEGRCPLLDDEGD